MSDEPSNENAEAGDVGSPPPHTAAPPGVPLMITKAQRAALRALGHADEAIAEMTPIRAHAILGEAQR